MMKDVMTGVYTYNGEEFGFVYRTNLSIREKDMLVMNVCDIIIADKDYHSLLKDLVFDFQIIVAFTDIDLSKMDEAEDKIDWIENFINETKVIDVIKSNLKEGLLEELEEAIDINIEYRTGIHKNILHEALSGLINTLEEKVEGVDTKTMMDMASALSDLNGELTTDNLIRSYINSDIFKENLKQE